MEPKTTSLITLGGLVVLSVVVVATATEVIGLDQNISALVRQQLNPAKEQMQTLTESVTRPGGRVVVVTTTRGSEESVDDFIARHDAVVASLIAK